MLPSADQLFKDPDFIFQQDLAPAQTAKSTKSLLNYQVLRESFQESSEFLNSAFRHLPMVVLTN